MAVNNSRSLTGDLREGMTDGRYRKVRPDTTALGADYGDGATAAERRPLHPVWHGYPVDHVVPAGRRVGPDGSSC